MQRDDFVKVYVPFKSSGVKDSKVCFNKWVRIRRFKVDAPMKKIKSKVKGQIETDKIGEPRELESDDEEYEGAIEAFCIYGVQTKSLLAKK
jgi:hypothetical protein